MHMIQQKKVFIFQYRLKNSEVKTQKILLQIVHSKLKIYGHDVVKAKFSDSVNWHMLSFDVIISILGSLKL